MSRPGPFAPLFSLAVVIALAASGVYAFKGSPFRAGDNVGDFRRPAWTADMDRQFGYPAYRLRDDGSALSVGRVVMQDDETVRVTLFSDMIYEPVEEARILLLSTDARALWSLVPRASKTEIAAEIEEMLNEVRKRFLAILQSPAFRDEYRGRLKAILKDAFLALQEDPDFRMEIDRVTWILKGEHAVRIAETMPQYVIPYLGDAALDMMVPSWDGVVTFVTEGQINLRPIGEAVTKVLADEEFVRTMSREMTTLLEDDRMWPLALDATDTLVDLVVADPRTEQLVEEIFSDPEFAAQIRPLEPMAAATVSTIFSRIVGRGEKMTPDALAVRIIRYIILRRKRLVAVILPEGREPPADVLARFDTLERVAP